MSKMEKEMQGRSGCQEFMVQSPIMSHQNDQKDAHLHPLAA